MILLARPYLCFIARKDPRDGIYQARRSAGRLVAGGQRWPVSQPELGPVSSRVPASGPGGSVPGGCGQVCSGPCWGRTLLSPLLSLVLTTTLQPFSKETSLPEALGNCCQRMSGTVPVTPWSARVREPAPVTPWSVRVREPVPVSPLSCRGASHKPRRAGAGGTRRGPLR